MKNIIGSGLIAEQLINHESRLNDKNIYFASGVANSNITDPDQFIREINMFQEVSSKLTSNETIVYFSSLGIFDTYRKTLPYFVHKKFMETLVARHPKFCIVRLGEIVAKSRKNPTLTNYFFFNLKKNEPTLIYSNARRFLTDIDTLMAFLIQNQNALNSLKTINLVPAYSFSPLSIYLEMAKMLSRTPNYSIVERNEYFEIPRANIHCIDEEKLKLGITKTQYLRQLLGKYYA